MEQDEDWYPISLQKHRIDHYRKSSMSELILMPFPDYLHNAMAKTLRPIALNAIEAYYKCDDDFDAFIPYLAMNYFDRVISRRYIKRVHDDEKRNEDLFVICCLMLAWKTRKRCFDLPYFLGMLQENYKKTDLNTMEFFIHETLRGEVRSLTPFSFAEYFISIFNLTGNQLSSTRKLVHQIIVTSQADMRIATFRPSLVAASAVYVVSKMLHPEQSFSMLQEVLSRWDNITVQGLSNCRKILEPICNAKVESWKSSSAKKDAKAETSSSGLGGIGSCYPGSSELLTPGSGDRPTMEEIQQDLTPSQALAPASAGTDDLKLDFELGWSKYDELIRETPLATSPPHCCWIL